MRKVAEPESSRLGASVQGPPRTTVSSSLRPRPNSKFASSVNSSRPPPSSSLNRNPPASSVYSQSSMARPPSAQSIHRPQTSMGHSRAKSQGTGLRTWNRGQDQQQYDTAQVMAPPAPSGMQQPFIISGNLRSTSLRPLMPRRDREWSGTIKRPASSAPFTAGRSVSASAVPQGSIVSAAASTASTGSRASRATTKPLARDASLCNAFQALSIQQRPSRRIASQSNDFSSRTARKNDKDVATANDPFGNTPLKKSKIPQLATPVSAKKLMPPPSFVPIKSPKKGVSCPPSPAKPLFLNKYSNLTEPTAWEPNELEKRLKIMEAMQNQLQSQMEGTTFERSSMKEMMEMMKQRSIFNAILLSCCKC
jgi:hypothetical protein